MKPAISLALVLILAPIALLAADEFEPRNRIDLHVTRAPTSGLPVSCWVVRKGGSCT